jgi:hypothetical protein
VVAVVVDPVVEEAFELGFETQTAAGPVIVVVVLVVMVVVGHI